MQLRTSATSFRAGFLAGLLFILPSIGMEPAAFGQTAQQLLQSYVGQKLILSGYGSEHEVQIKRDEQGIQKGGCDVAVEIKKAIFEEDRLRLWLEDIGNPIVHNAVPQKCAASPYETILTVSCLHGHEPPDSIAEFLGQILQTPAAYLAANGISFSSPAAEVNAPEVDSLHPGTTAPRILLNVTASYTDDARRRHVQGVVRALIEVDTDGRARNGRIVKSLDPSLDQRVLKVLPLFRFDPARKDGQPVAVRVLIEMSFRLF